MKEESSGFINSLLDFRPYFAILREVKYRFIFALVFGAVYGAASGFGFPFMLYKVLPVVFGDESPGLWVMVGVASLLPVVFIIRGASAFGNGYLSAYCGIHVQNVMKADVFEKLQRLPLSFFAANRVGDIMSRVRVDVAAVQRVATVVSSDLIKYAVTFAGAIAYLVYMAVQNEELIFVLFALAIIPLCTQLIRMLGKKILHRSRQLAETVGNINVNLHENLTAVREVRAFNLQKREIRRFRSLLRELALYSLKAAKYSQLLPQLIELVSAMGFAAAIVYASQKGMGLDKMLPLMAALYMSYDPIKKISNVQSLIKRGQASLTRIEYVLHADECVTEPSDPVPFDPAGTDIEFHDVRFRYDKEPVLNGITTSLPAGTVVALVGPSGAGKSTFANLIPRFYDVLGGSITIGGQDIRRYALHDLRKHISIVSQETILFRDTIRNNIRVGRLNASDEEVEEAARRAHAHEFIEQFADGYETNAGDRGTRLSGGQKQRIAIARAFLKNAPILILDEATSSLDSYSEEMIQKALAELIQGKTVIIIAHRFSTIKMADVILVLEDGRIRASGSHGELYGTDELYRSLYDRQFTA